MMTRPFTVSIQQEDESTEMRYSYFSYYINKKERQNSSKNIMI